MTKFTDEYTSKTEELHFQIEKFRYEDTAKEFEFADKLFALASENNDQENISYALLRKSDDFISQENFPLAFTYICDAKQIAEENNFNNLRIRCYSSFATMYNSIGDIHKTMAALLEAYKIVQKNHEGYPEAYILNKMGDLFLQHGCTKRATVLFERAIAEYPENSLTGYNTIDHFSALYSNLFFTLFKQGSFKTAISYHSKRALYLENNSAIIKLYYLFEDAYIFYHFDETEKLYKQVNSILDSIDQDSFYIYNTLETLKHFFAILYFTKNKDLIWQGIQKIKAVLSKHSPLPIKICLTKNIILYYQKYKPQNTASIVIEYEKMEQLREKHDMQIDSFNCHEMELQIQAAEESLKHEQTIKEKEMYQAMYNQDPITGLLNRRGLTDAFNKMYKQKKSTSTIGLIILDIDCFKQYNDNYGHIKGDSAIIAVATALQKNADTYFVPARFGGDEFVCLAKNQTELAIKNYIESVQKDLANNHISHKFSTVDNPYVTTSIGYCNEQFTDSISLEKLIYKSDIALYEAKSAGKNCIRSS